jgi:virulence factor Mce-like protein
MTTTRLGLTFTRGITIVCVIALVLAGSLWWLLREPAKNHITAYFSGAVGLYEGNSVRVLGVEIGTVGKVEPLGDRVKVELDYDRSVDIPASARAVIVAPSLVSDRYVQLGPAYQGGPKIAQDAVIPLERTDVPLETDDLYKSLSGISEALGPNGANKNGSLSDLLTVAANNLQGNGQEIHDTINRLAQATGTLSGNKDDLFATIENLAKFTTTLANSDGQVRKFENQLADVSGFLAGQRDSLAATVKQLGTALTLVSDFIAKNRDRIKSNVDKLASVTRVLVQQRSSLAEALDIAPLALGNVVNAYNASSGTLDARPIINELTQPPAAVVCGLLKQAPAGQELFGQLCSTLAPVVDGLVPIPSVAQVINGLNTGQLPPLPLPIVGQLYGSPSLTGGAQ